MSTMGIVSTAVLGKLFLLGFWYVVFSLAEQKPQQVRVSDWEERWRR